MSSIENCLKYIENKKAADLLSALAKYEKVEDLIYDRVQEISEILSHMQENCDHVFIEYDKTHYFPAICKHCAKMGHL